MTEFTKQLQVMRQHLVKHSSDSRVVAIYDSNLTCHSSEKCELRAAWRLTTVALERAEAAAATMDIVGQAAIGTQGLGFGKRSTVSKNGCQEHRKRVCDQVELEAEQIRFAEEADHVVQGRWQKWADVYKQLTHPGIKCSTAYRQS